MRIVADTNVVISGLLWHGNERQVLNAARDNIIELCTSSDLLEELAEVLARPKFHERLLKRGVDLHLLVDGFGDLATTVVVTEVSSKQISRDKDDDVVLECAMAGECEAIVTGDSDLLDLKEYKGIRIIRTVAFLDEIGLLEK
jgi:putative PIN family toxin of toxin-antitoxin system